jgi:hypothetical protein
LHPVTTTFALLSPFSKRIIVLVPAPADAATASNGRGGGGNLADQAACTVPDPFDTPVLQFFSGVMIVDSAGVCESERVTRAMRCMV